MTDDTTGETTSDETKPLAGEVTVYEKPTYTVVKLVLQNPKENPIFVELRQSLPEDVTDSQVTFASQYLGDAWTFENGELTFSIQLDDGEMTETAYGARGVSLETLLERIRVATITITDETGENLGTLTGLRPTVAEKTTDDSASDADTDEFEAADLHGEETETADEKSGDDTESEPREDEDEPDEDEVESEDEPDEDEVESEDEPDEDDADKPAATADLPANRSDYILEDVRGEIKSPSEFEWVELETESTDEERGGIIGWVRSLFS